MTIKVVTTCPLGSKCEEIKDGALHVCAWFIQMAGTNPSTGESVDEKGCAMRWVPILLVENAKQARGTTGAVESLRNEVVNSNDAARTMMMAAASLPAMAKMATLIQGAEAKTIEAPK